MKKFVLIDGNSIMNRAFYGIMGSKMLMTKDGTYTNAVYGFLAILFKLLDDINPDYMAVAFDLKAPTARHKLYEGYKATRKGMPEELAMQMPIIKEILTAMNIDIIEKEGYEADDIIGTISTIESKAGNKVNIISADHDLLQLCNDLVSLVVPNNPEDIWTPVEIMNEYFVTPKQFIDVKTLMGDKSDNIPGAAGIGPKTASKLIHKYGNLFNIYMNISDIESNMSKGKSISTCLINSEDNILLSKILATIKTDVELDAYNANVSDNMLNEISEQILGLYELNSIISILKNGNIVCL